jgi:hypothetical protein
VSKAGERPQEERVPNSCKREVTRNYSEVAKRGVNHGSDNTDHPDTFARYRHRRTGLDRARILTVAWVLCFSLHVVVSLGWKYIQQPLHTIEFCTREYPHGDRGGNPDVRAHVGGSSSAAITRRVGRTAHVEQQRPHAEKHSDGVPYKVFKIRFERISEHRAGSVGAGELRDRQKDSLPERRTAWNAKGPTERLPRRYRCAGLTRPVI